MATERLVLNGHQLKDLLEFINPDGEDNLEQLDTEVAIMYRESFQEQDEGHVMPAGHYAYLVEYPEEGLYGPLANPE